MTIANNRFTVRTYWMETTREGHVKYNWKKMGDETYIYSTDSIQRTRKAEREKYGTKNSNPKIDHKISSTKEPEEM